MNSSCWWVSKSLTRSMALTAPGSLAASLNVRRVHKYRLAQPYYRYCPSRILSNPADHQCLHHVIMGRPTIICSLVGPR